MRLLFVIKGLVVPGGGAERVFVDVVNALAGSGHEVEVATFDHPGQRLFYDLDQAITVHMLGASEAGQPTPRRNLVKIMRGVRKLARQTSPDAVVAFMHSAFVPVAFGLLGTGVRYVASEHIDANHFADRPVERVVADFARNRSAAVTIPTTAARATYPCGQKKHMTVLPNPLDFSRYRAAGREKPAEPPVILTVGRFMEQKGHALLVKAFSRLTDQFPDWKLRFVGDGVLRPDLEALIKELGLVGKVEMPGNISGVASEYAAASIVAIPSYYESFGMVAAEALAANRPVVGFSDCSGINELIADDVNGILVPSGGDRVTSLEKELSRLMTDTTLRRRLSRGDRSSLDKYDLTNAVDEWESFLANVVAKK